MAFSQDGELVMGFMTGGKTWGRWGGAQSDRGPMLDLELPGMDDFTRVWQVYRREDGPIKLYKDPGTKILLKQGCHAL